MVTFWVAYFKKEPWCTTHFILYFTGFWVEFFISSIFLLIHLFILIFNYRKRKPWMLLLTMKNLILQHFSWLHDRVNHVALHVVETETPPNIYFNEKEVSKRSQSGSVCRSSIFFLFLQEQILPIYFFFRGHGNESCNLIGSLPGQYFPISAHGPRYRFRGSPSTSQISLPFFINISGFFPARQYF